MIFTSEERRKVAKNLRDQAEAWRNIMPDIRMSDRRLNDSIHLAFGLDDIDTPVHEALDMLADLIDPPAKGTAEGTCRTCAKYDGSVCILDDFAPGSLDNTCAYDSYEARAVTDAERREVVERLRAPMESMLADSAGELIRLRRVTGCRRGQDIYERLADLIEGKN